MNLKQGLIRSFHKKRRLMSNRQHPAVRRWFRSRFRTEGKWKRDVNTTRTKRPPLVGHKTNTGNSIKSQMARLDSPVVQQFQHKHKSLQKQTLRASVVAQHLLPVAVRGRCWVFSLPLVSVAPARKQVQETVSQK